MLMHGARQLAGEPCIESHTWPPPSGFVSRFDPATPWDAGSTARLLRPNFGNSGRITETEPK